MILIQLFMHLVAVIWFVLGLLWAILVRLVTGRTSETIKFGHKVWAPAVLKMLGLDFQMVRNDLHLLGGRSCIIVANHQGYLDIPVVIRALSVYDYRFLAKSSLFKIPVMSWYLRLAGFIPVYRREPARAVEGLAKAVQPLALGQYSVLGFPEGTRTYDGEIRPFKKGMFVMAIDGEVPILPVVISGSYEAWPRHSKGLIKPGKVRVSILRPVETKGMVYEDRDKLVAKVRNAMVAELELLRSEGGE